MSMDGSSVASSSAIEHLRWALTPEVGPVLFGRIVARFGSAQEALGAGVHLLAEVEGIGRETAERIVRGRAEADVPGEVSRAAEHGVRIICGDDAEYPALLRHIPDPPICLYVRGRLERTDGVGIAIVGARRCTIYGREQAYRFGHQLAARGMTVISGLARGADSEAHKGALAAEGRTLAVLGNGLARIYPPEHEELAERIARQGAVISALPMTTSPERTNFLPRNRIIAGLSLGTIVVEAAARSGALATARLASEYNREVFALPGRADSDYSVGTNRMIRDQHAKLVTCADDVLDELGEAGAALRELEGTSEAGTLAAEAARAKLTDDEEAIRAVLDLDGRPIEAIAEATDFPPSKVAATLIALQLKGLVRQLLGNVFVRVSGG